MRRIIKGMVLFFAFAMALMLANCGGGDDEENGGNRGSTIPTKLQGTWQMNPDDNCNPPGLAGVHRLDIESDTLHDTVYNLPDYNMRFKVKHKYISHTDSILTVKPVELIFCDQSNYPNVCDSWETFVYYQSPEDWGYSLDEVNDVLTIDYGEGNVYCFR